MPPTITRSPVVFFSPDSPDAAQALADLLHSLPQARQVLGLVVKFVATEAGGQVVNWEFADADLLKAMALVLPEPLSNPAKE